MRIGVTGGRFYEKGYVVSRILDKFANSTILVYGCCSGADQIASDYADARGWTKDPFPADWEKYDKAAGPIRNQAMVDSGLDILIAFPGGSGTEDMVSRAKRAGILVLRVEE